MSYFAVTVPGGYAEAVRHVNDLNDTAPMQQWEIVAAHPHMNSPYCEMILRCVPKPAGAA